MSEIGETPVKNIQEKFEPGEIKGLDQRFIGKLEAGRSRLKQIFNNFIDPKSIFEQVTELHDRLSNPIYTGMGIWILEAIREYSLGDMMGAGFPLRSEPINWVKNLPAIENMGNLSESYLASMLTYYGISLLNTPIKQKIPEKIKVAVAFLAGSAFFTALETGLIKVGTPDLADIPAGAVGPLIFSGVMLLNKKFIKDCGSAIKDLGSQIKGKGK